MTENTPTTEKVLALFAEAWRPLDPAGRLGVSVIYSRAIADVKPLKNGSDAGRGAPRRCADAVLPGAGARRSPACWKKRPSTPRAAKWRPTTIPEQRLQRRRSCSCIAAAGSCATSTSTTAGAPACEALRDARRRVDYARAPEHPFPIHSRTALRRCVRCSATAPNSGMDAARVAIAGDSSGADLALATCLKLRQPGPSRCAAPR